MSRFMRVGVDIDGVVVDTPGSWKEYLEQLCGYKLPAGELYDYNLTNHFREALDDMGVDGYEWWRRSDLYDDLAPVEHAVETLEEMNKDGCEIIFISALKGNHHKSKVNFIKRYFPFYDAFLGTKEKGYVDVDIMVDDRLNNLQQFDDNVGKLLYNTPYEQTVPLDNASIKNIFHAPDWQVIRDDWGAVMDILQRTHV